MRNSVINTISFSDIGLPREIPFGLKLKVFLGNVIFVIGFVFFLIGSLFLFIFGSNADFTSIVAFDDSQPRVKAIVTVISETNSSEHKKDIYCYTVKYNVNKKDYTSDSYDSGSSLQVNDTVDLQYKFSDPSVSVISGMRKAPFSIWIILVVIVFPLLGFLLAFFGFKKSRGHIRLLKTGLLAKGKVLVKYPTNIKINNRTVYNVHFEFKAQNGQIIKASVKTHQPELVEDEKTEHLVYDAENPEKAVLIDVLPKAVRNFLSLN